MAAPKKIAPPSKTHQLPVRFTEEEYELLSQYSDQFNMSRGGFLRHILTHKKVVAPKKIIHNDRDIIAELRQLNKLGSNLNQIAKVCNQTGSVTAPLAKQIKESLRTLDLSISRFNRLVEEEYGRH